MNARLLGAALCCACATNRPLVAGDARPPPDGEAMREAMDASRGSEHYVSARALYHYLRATMSRDRDDYPDAAQELKQALVYDPDAPELHAALADVHARAGQFDRAEAAARAALEKDPHQASAHFLLGRMYAARKQYGKALKHLEAAVESDPKMQAAHRMLITTYLELDEPENAEKSCERMARSVPAADDPASRHFMQELAQGWADLAQAAARRRDFGAAERLYGRAREADPSDAALHLAAAGFLEGRGKREAASEAYRAALRRDPDDVETLRALARLALLSGDRGGAQAYGDKLNGLAGAHPDRVCDALKDLALQELVLRRFNDALELLARAEALRPGDAQTAYFRAVVLEEKGEVDAAVAAYDALDAESPLVLDARTRAAAALSRKGAHAEALARLEGLVRERPGALGAAVALAWVYDRAGRTADGVALLEKLAADRSAEADVLDALASLYARVGRHADAVALLKSAAAAHPREEKVRYAFGSALDRAGRDDEALAEMRAVLDLNPDSPDAMNFIGYSLVDRNVSLDEAEKLLQRAQELRPENGYITDSLGWLSYRRGDFARATQLLERADQLSPNEPVILDHLGDAYLGAARRAPALDAFRRALGALDKNPDPRIRGDLERKLKSLAP